SATGAVGTAFLQVEGIQFSDNPGNGNGIPESGEGGRMVVTLKNYGVQTATSISGALTAPSASVTVGLPNSRSYPDLPPLATASNAASPLLFSIATDIGCPANAPFTFNANYGNGGPLSQALNVPIGVTSFTFTKNLDGTVPTPAFPGVVASTGTQNFRLN